MAAWKKVFEEPFVTESLREWVTWVSLDSSEPRGCVFGRGLPNNAHCASGTGDQWWSLMITWHISNAYCTLLEALPAENSVLAPRPTLHLPWLWMFSKFMESRLDSPCSESRPLLTSFKPQLKVHIFFFKMLGTLPILICAHPKTRCTQPGPLTMVTSTSGGYLSRLHLHSSRWLTYHAMTMCAGSPGAQHTLR